MLAHITGQGFSTKRLGFGASPSAAAFFSCSITGALAADMDAIVTKAPPYAMAPAAVRTAAVGGLANGDISRTNAATTAGVRFQF